MSKSRFHPGELAIQKKYNIQHNPRIVEMMLKDHISKRYIPFIENQSTLIVSTKDKNDNIWSSMVFGDIGLVNIKSPKQLIIQLDKIRSTKKEILFQNILPNSQIGILFIDTETRSRFRLNGHAILFPERIEITITEAYPNCPKYIQQRIPILQEKKLESQIEQGTTLKESHRKLIQNADTFFMSSMNANGDMDASHRGGEKGFIKLLDNGTLKIPDYVGNNLFNSLGNLLENPLAGLLFMDFDKGNSLQLTGKTKLLFDQHSDEDLIETTGTGRFWLFETQNWIETKFHNYINWELISYSPFNPKIL